mgnify:CR=1 FL=1
MLIDIISIFSAVSFFYYGLVCLFSERMVEEFERFGLSSFQRKSTGSLQLLGSFGLLIGIYLPLATALAALGLSALMLLGWLTRLRIKDGFIQSFPAFFYMILNLYVALVSFGLLPQNWS